MRDSSVVDRPPPRASHRRALVSHRRQPYRRAAALALAFAWLIAPALATVHSEGHAHRFCAEHRAFEEGAPEALEQTGGAVASVTSAVDVGPLAGAAHLRCPVVYPASRDAAPASPGILTEVSPPPAPVLALAEKSCHAPLELLSLAPKLSPPQA